MRYSQSFVIAHQAKRSTRAGARGVTTTRPVLKRVLAKLRLQQASTRIRSPDVTSSSSGDTKHACHNGLLPPQSLRILEQPLNYVQRITDLGVR